MKRRPRTGEKRPISVMVSEGQGSGDIGIVLSGGGSRAAYQVGALRGLLPYLEKESGKIRVVVGSSIGAINGLILAACLNEGMPHAVSALEEMWSKRTFRNTFAGSPSQAFFRAIKMAMMQYMSPGPKPTSDAVFDPTPLMEEVDGAIMKHGGLHPENRHPDLTYVAVMTTIEGAERKPMLFLSSHKEIDQTLLKGASFEVCYVDNLSGKHGFASAALPSVLPPVELDTDHGKVRLVDGGISQNVPVDPAVRMGAERVILVDISGRSWWLDEYDEPHDTRPSWEIPAGFDTFCFRPPDTFVIKNQQPFGPILQAAVGGSTRRFIEAVGPTWPVFKLLKTKMGERLAYEVMTYVALDPEYLAGLMEQGYNDTRELLRNKSQIEFSHNENYEKVATAL